MIVVRETAPDIFMLMGGNTELLSLDGTTRAPLFTILADSWSAEDRAAYGIFLAVPFTTPEGKQAVGAPSYERTDGIVYEIFTVEDIPAPEAEVFPIGQRHQAIETTSGTLAIDLDLGWRIGLTLHHTLTALSFTNVPAAGQFCAVTLDISNEGAFNITGWPANLKWVGGAAPTITSGVNKLDTILLTTDDAGSEFRAYIGAQNMM